MPLFPFTGSSVHPVCDRTRLVMLAGARAIPAPGSCLPSRPFLAGARVQSRRCPGGLASLRTAGLPQARCCGQMRPNNSFKPNPLRGPKPKPEPLGRVGLIQVLGRKCSNPAHHLTHRSAPPSASLCWRVFSRRFQALSWPKSHLRTSSPGLVSPLFHSGSC
jgi:hypothetical protein